MSSTVAFAPASRVRTRAPRAASSRRALSRAPRAAIAPPAAPASSTAPSSSPTFDAAPLSRFALENLELKGPRSNVDVGDPHDSSLPFVKGALGGAASCGSWACTPGGWDSPNARPSTEWFYVLSGRGAVTDPDGTPHPFGPGDVVVLPKGWYGRWDITEHIHKIWLTLTHDDVPGASLRPEVFAAASATPATPPGQNAAVAGASSYECGSFRAGFWARAPGADCVAPTAAAELFHVLEGEMFVVEEDGATARRCVAGDLVFLPEGWRGASTCKSAAPRRRRCASAGRGRGRGGGGEGRRGRHLRRGVSDCGARRVEAGGGRTVRPGERQQEEEGLALDERVVKFVRSTLPQRADHHCCTCRTRFRA